MRVRIILLWVLMSTVAAVAADSAMTPEERWRRRMEGPHVKQGKLPDLKLQRPMTATADEAAQIKKHIANLAKIDRPDFGLSGTMGGMAFAPVPGSESHLGGLLLTDHQLKTSEDFRQLVAFGPRALPFLLDALDDNTPTQLSQNHGGGFGAMYFSTEVGSNPTNLVEQKAIAALPKRDGLTQGKTITEYTVKVGDVCFAIIGQIVGRAYLAVRYQPTAIIVINSPVEEKLLAKAVRDIWSSTNAAQRLLESLLFDYATEGVFNGQTLDGWGIASRLQCQAALRMLYYFPQQTGGIIAERLRRLDVGARGTNQTEWIKGQVTDGVRAEDFIKAVAWCNEPTIRREVLDIFKRTTDPQLLLASLSAIDSTGREIAKKRLNEMIDQLPLDERGPYGQGFKLLVALGNTLGVEAKPTFVRYLENASLQRWRTMARVLRQTQSDWAVELLSPALTDKREFGGTYALVPGQDETRRLIRVCDEAAVTISLARPDLPFKMAGEHEELDRQIATMRARIIGVRP